jgi:peroxiredoxin
MHQKYSSKGVLCFSVSVDEGSRKAAVLTFLEKQHATFPNFLLDVEQEVWQEKFHVRAPPAVFVFDRDGKLAQRFDTEDGHRYTYEDVEKLVKDLIRPGP